jgi:hypothetical protein
MIITDLSSRKFQITFIHLTRSSRDGFNEFTKLSARHVHLELFGGIGARHMLIVEIYLHDVHRRVEMPVHREATTTTSEYL